MNQTPFPAVSVLMPAYNAERYIEEAAESILAQTFTDFEFLIIDDGSTDGTRSILERIAARDSRVRLVSRPNAGYVVSLNEMIGMARAPLLARMDADDVAFPGRFEQQVAFLNEHPEVVAVGGMVDFIDYRGRLIAPGGHPAMSHEELQDAALSGKCPLNHPSVMMRSEEVRAVGGYRPEMEPAEDMDLWLRLGERGQVVNLPVTVTRYRLHDKSVSAVRQSRQLDRFRAASLEACARRGIAPRFESSAPWRPTDRVARGKFNLWCGWGGFNRGDRLMAIEYGLRAVGLIPFTTMSWRLLACALLKPPKPRTAPASVADPTE
ncbi:glycosyltransferase [Tautonia sp. JC769]|uniref:glycosyltransferase family 2 protein n=1 Tax=Tautonia sp. JC769 TaxID=3232135 RepID=UPI00345866B4